MESADLKLAFVVDHYQISDQEIGGDPEFLKEFFESTIDQIIHAVDGTLVYKDITAHSGRDVCIWKATYLEGKGIIKGHLIIEKDKYYGLQAFALNNDTSDKLMQKFFDSFQVLTTTKP